jgi:hypothetical protein
MSFSTPLPYSPLDADSQTVMPSRGRRIFDELPASEPVTDVIMHEIRTKGEGVQPDKSCLYPCERQSLSRSPGYLNKEMFLC